MTGKLYEHVDVMLQLTAQWHYNSNRAQQGEYLAGESPLVLHT